MFPEKSCLAVIVGLLLCQHSAAFDKAESRQAILQDTAKAFVSLLQKGAFDKATGDFNASLLEALPSDKLKAMFEKVVGDAGAFKKRLSSRMEKSDKYDAVVITCIFEKANVDARIVFDEAAKIIGVFFGPWQPTGVEEIFEGLLKVGDNKLRLVFHLFKQKDNTYLGLMDSPNQGAKGITINKVSIDDEIIRLEVKTAKLLYVGKRAKDGKEIVGTLKLEGRSVPLKLKKAIP